MAWVTPRTFVAAAVLTAAQLNETRDNLKALLPLDAVAGSTWVPTFTQSGAVSKTTTMAEYQQIGKWVMFTLELTASGAGTANNPIIVGTPVTAASGNFQTVASGHLIDASATALFPFVAYLASTTTMRLVDATASTASSLSLGQTGTAFALALASSDVVTMSGLFRAA